MFRFMIAAFLLLSAAAASAAEPSDATLGYQAYLDRLSAALPELGSNEIDLATAKNDVTASKSAGNAALSLGGKTGSTTQYSDPGGTKGDIAESSLSAALSKKIVSTGTTVEASGSYYRDAYSSFGASDSTTYKPAVSVKVTQPLLYNFLGKIDRFTERDAKAKLDIAAIRLSENNKSTLNAYKKLFFQWESSRRILRSSEDSIVNAQLLSSQVERNYRAGLAEDYTYQQTVTSVLSYRGIRQQKQTALSTVEKQLAVYIDSEKLTPDGNDFSGWYKAALDESYSPVPFASTESAKILELTLARCTDAADVYKNALLPELDVYGSATKKDRSSGAAVSGLSDTDYAIGFSMSYKLGNDAAQAQYESALLQQKSILLERRATENSYRKSLAQIQETAAGKKALIKNKEETLKALELQLASQRKKYGQGRLGISDVITTENSIDSAKIELISLQYDLIANYIDYKDLVK